MRNTDLHKTDPWVTLHTARLDLVAGNTQLLRAEGAGRTEVSEALRATVPEAWPPEHLDDEARAFWLAKLEAHPEEHAWWGWFILLRRARMLIGIAGYVGPPDATGEIAVGYSVLPAFQRQGYATEALQGLLERAFASSTATACAADTFPSLLPSIRVLEKCGFSPAGEGAEPGTIRFRLRRSDWAAARAR